MRAMLIGLGHDVSSVAERDPRASDVEVLATAVEEGRILITEDKDFGELVFVRRLPYSCIIRFVEMRVEEKVSAMRPWYKVVTLREKVREGRSFSPDEFAIALEQVRVGRLRVTTAIRRSFSRVCVSRAL